MSDSVLNPFPNKPWFLCVVSASLLKTLWDKEKLLVMSNFSFSHSVFYPFGEFSNIFIKFENVVCKLFQFRRVLNLLFGKRLNSQRKIGLFLHLFSCLRILLTHLIKQSWERRLLETL